MSYTLEVTKFAEQDIQESIDWYETEQIGLGREFLIYVEKTLFEIKDNPYLNPVYYKEHRKAKTSKFKFSIVYRIKNEKIIVSAVYHDSRDPLNLVKRLLH